MKNLKIKLGLFSLLAIFAVSVFLTSCEQEDIMTQTTEELTVEEGVMYTLPKECNTMSEDELNEYLSSLTSSELSNLPSIDNDLESRGICRSWSTIGTYCYLGLRVRHQRRWCYPPTNHPYSETRVVFGGSC